MALTITIVVAVLLTLLVLVISRGRTSEHQEELNTHPEPGEDPVTTDPDDLEPKADRPAGPDAEAMGADVGHPSTQPQQER